MINEREQAHPTSQSSASDAGEPAVAEDNVAQSQVSASQQSQSNSLNSLEKYCEENPSASQCLIYEE